MQILAIAKYSPWVMLPSTSDFFSSLPFSPVKLAVLIVWVYICLYFVQFALLSPFVPKKIRTIVSLATLFAGPFPLFLLLVIDTAVKATENQSSPGNRHRGQGNRKPEQHINNSQRTITKSGCKTQVFAFQQPQR
ncbi:MAG: hypothetical protein ACYSTN_05670 [Planctomycetota bacterium]